MLKTFGYPAMGAFTEHPPGMRCGPMPVGSMSVKYRRQRSAGGQHHGGKRHDVTWSDLDLVRRFSRRCLSTRNWCS